MLSKHSDIADEVLRLYKKSLPRQLQVIEGKKEAHWWNPDSDISLPRESVPQLFAEEPWVLLKSAKNEPSWLLGPVADIQGWGKSPWGQINSLWGGSRPIANILAGAALGAGLGGTAGWLTGYLFPEDVVDRSKIRNTGAVVGGLLGAVPGLYHAYDNTRMGKGLTDTWPTKVSQAFSSLDETRLVKSAVSSGAFVAPSVNVDRFNRVVWDDELTPPPVAATASGVVAGAGAARGSNWVSPADIARVAAGAGAGLAAGTMVGRTLGAMAGLSDSYQRGLQQTGMWAGLLSSVTPVIFGR